AHLALLNVFVGFRLFQGRLVTLKSRFDQSIGLNEVSDRLNAMPDVTLELIGNGSLTALRGPFADGFREWRFAPDAPERLLEEIRHRLRTGTQATACSCPTTSTTHTIFSVVESVRGEAGLSVGRLVRAVLDGFVRPCEETQTDKGLSRFRLDETAFCMFKASEGILREEPPLHFTGVGGLTDEQWALVGRLLRKPRYRGEEQDDDACWGSREVIAGIWWVLSNRAEWHALPRRFPPAQTCYEWMKAWICPKRVFKKALDILARDLHERGRVDHTQFICDGYGLELKGGQSCRRMPQELRAHDSWQRQTLLALLSYYKYSLFNLQNMPPIRR
ncbi:MAG: transposase, partial [Acidobacteria bacterium]|nr:transposase [Acidobacteriota bacterium]